MMYVFHNLAIESGLGLDLKTSSEDLCVETSIKTLTLVLDSKTKTFMNWTRVPTKPKTLVLISQD